MPSGQPSPHGPCPASPPGPSCQQHPDGSTCMCRDAGQGQPAPLVGLLILGDDVVTKQPQETDTQRPRVLTAAAAAAAKSLQSCPTLCDPPNRRQPSRLPRPWDSPGKNTGVGCHFLLKCMKVKSQSELVQSCPTLSNPMDCSLHQLKSTNFSDSHSAGNTLLPTRNTW